MLDLRPNCECCDRDLPNGAPDALICTFECTFCADCARTRLGGLCPNCGGGFMQRPIRRARNWKDKNYLGKDPAGTRLKHRPVEARAHGLFAHKLRTIPPHAR